MQDGNRDVGRDHNGQGFSMWLAGGGFQGGMTYGATDEFGHQAWKISSRPTITRPRCCIYSAWIIKS